jgi:Domain of unknown function (DUF397)
VSTMDLSRVAWRRSSRSSNGGEHCVEVASAPALRLVRDSKDPSGPALAFTPAEWRIFTDRVKASVFDSGAGSCSWAMGK